MAGFAENGGLFPYMENSVRRTLFDSGNIGEIPENRDGWTVERLEWTNPANQKRKRILQSSAGWQYLQGEGQTKGHLIGGCLEVLDWNGIQAKIDSDWRKFTILENAVEPD